MKAVDLAGPRKNGWRNIASITNEQQIEARSIRKLTAEQAKAYLTAAGSDKDKAREAARKDGWEF